MSLFVGNISRNVRMQQLEDAFEKYGRCSIRQNRSFAFIEYDDERSAEDAMKYLQGQDMGGLRIGIEWSKRSRRFDPKSSLRPHARDRDDDKCYNCNKTGHYARDCRSQRRDRRSRSRSPRGHRGDRRRDSRSRSRSPRDKRRGDRRDRSRSPPRRHRRGGSRGRDNRSRSRDDSRDRKPRENDDRERSPAPDQDRRTSESPRGNRERDEQIQQRDERDFMERKASQEDRQPVNGEEAAGEDRQRDTYVDESRNQANGGGDEKHDAAAEADQGERLP